MDFPPVINFILSQAEDGIRDFHVTGVQTCALPIFRRRPVNAVNQSRTRVHSSGTGVRQRLRASKASSTTAAATFTGSGTKPVAFPKVATGLICHAR